MKAFAIKCNNPNCDNCDLWLGYAKRPLCSNRVSFPLLGGHDMDSPGQYAWWIPIECCKIVDYNVFSN